VDRTNHHLFQPLLHQVATAGLTARAVSAPIRHADYDHLIVAAGATHSHLGHDAGAAHAPGLKTLVNAFAICARVVGAFERAERCTEGAMRESWMTFVITGAGPVGVEMSGSMTEIARHTLPQEFRRIDSTHARVVLIKGSDRLLGAFVPRLSQRALEQLVGLGVDVPHLQGDRHRGRRRRLRNDRRRSRRRHDTPRSEQERDLGRRYRRLAAGPGNRPWHRCSAGPRRPRHRAARPERAPESRDRGGRRPNPSLSLFGPFPDLVGR
jgi:hypothetical protein